MQYLWKQSLHCQGTPSRTYISQAVPVDSLQDSLQLWYLLLWDSQFSPIIHFSFLFQRGFPRQSFSNRFACTLYQFIHLMCVDSIWKCSASKVQELEPFSAASQSAVSGVIKGSAVQPELHVFTAAWQAAWGVFLQEERKLPGTVLKTKTINVLPTVCASPECVFFFIVKKSSVSHFINNFIFQLSLPNPELCLERLCARDKSSFMKRFLM